MKTLLSLAKIALPLSLLLTVLAGLTCVPKGSPFKFQIPLERNLESNLLSNLGAIYTGNKTSDDNSDERNDEIKVANEEFARTQLGGTGLAVGPEGKLEDADKTKPRVYVWGRKPYIEGTLPTPPGFTPTSNVEEDGTPDEQFGGWLADQVDELDNDRRNNLRKLNTAGLALAAAPVVTPPPVQVVRTNPHFDLRVAAKTMTLSGELPSQAVKDNLVAKAKAAFPTRRLTSDTSTVKPDTLKAASWAASIDPLIASLGKNVEGDTGRLAVTKPQQLILEGSALSPTAYDQTVALANRVPGTTRNFSGWRKPAPMTNPYFAMDVSKGGVELTGELPSEDARRLLVTSAEANFKGRDVTDNLAVKTKGLNNVAWVGQTGNVLSRFSGSVQGDTGYLGINQAGVLTARGSAKDAAAKAGFTSFAGTIPGLASRNVNLSVPAPPAPTPAVVVQKTNPYFDMNVTKGAVDLVGELPTAAAKTTLARQTARSFPGRTINDKKITVNTKSLNARPWVGQTGPLVSKFGTTVQGDTGRLSISKQNQLVAVGSCKNQAAYDNFDKYTGRLRGVKSNLTGLKVPAPKSPSHYMVNVGENSIRLEGLVPTDATKSSLAASTKRALPTRTGVFMDNTNSGGADAPWVPAFTSLVSGYGNAVDAAGGSVGIDASGNVIVTGVAKTKAGHNSVNSLAASVPGNGADTTGWTFTPPTPAVVERPKPKPLPIPEPAPAAVDNRLLPTINTIPLEGARREPAPAPDGPGTVREIRTVPSNAGRIIQVPTGDGQWRTVDRPPAGGDWRTINGATQRGTIQPGTIRPGATIQTIPMEPMRTVPFRGTTTPIRGTSTSGDWRPVDGSAPVPVRPSGVGIGGPRVLPMAETTSVRPTPRTIPVTQATTPATATSVSSSASTFGGVAPRITISRGAGNWAVSGVVPSQSDSDSILSAVTRSSIGQGGAQIVDRIKVDPGATRSSWVGAYASMLSAMREVQDAQLNVDGNRIILRGKVSSEERKAAVAGNVRSRLGDSTCMIQNDLQAL